MLRVRFQKLEVSVGKFSHMLWQLFISLPEWRDASKWPRLSCTKIGERFVRQSIQFAGPNISFDLPVPPACLQSLEPFGECLEVFRLQLADIFLNLFKFRHDCSFHDQTVRYRGIKITTDFRQLKSQAGIVRLLTLSQRKLCSLRGCAPDQPISMNLSTSTRPLSDIFRCGMTGRGRNASCRNGSSSVAPRA